MSHKTTVIVKGESTAKERPINPMTRGMMRFSKEMQALFNFYERPLIERISEPTFHEHSFGIIDAVDLWVQAYQVNRKPGHLNRQHSVTKNLLKRLFKSKNYHLNAEVIVDNSNPSGFKEIPYKGSDPYELLYSEHNAWRAELESYMARVEQIFEDCLLYKNITTDIGLRSALLDDNEDLIRFSFFAVILLSFYRQKQYRTNFEAPGTKKLLTLQEIYADTEGFVKEVLLMKYDSIRCYHSESDLIYTSNFIKMIPQDRQNRHSLSLRNSAIFVPLGPHDLLVILIAPESGYWESISKYYNRVDVKDEVLAFNLYNATSLHEKSRKFCRKNAALSVDAYFDMVTPANTE